MFKRLLLIFAVLFFSLQIFSSGDAIAQKVRLIKTGDLFPELQLPVPGNTEKKNYLGLEQSDTFTLKGITAKVVFVEILSVYCPSCQRQVRYNNQLYDLIESDPKTKGHIKIIGVAAGNGRLEVKDFVRRYKPKYPVLPDPKFEMHRAIGGSRTPFDIYVRQDPAGGAGVVADTHLGPSKQSKQVFNGLNELMTISLADIGGQAGELDSQPSVVRAILSENELQAKVKDIFSSFDGSVTDFQQIDLSSERRIYTVRMDEAGVSRRLFAEVISRPPTCGECHDIHFIYVFESSGEVLRFVPLQLTKWGNKSWNDADIAKMRSRILGKSLTKPFVFDPQVDAVSSATITSSIIFDSLSQGNKLLGELKAMGLI